MLSKFFVARWRIRALEEGPAGTCLAGFGEMLVQNGYPPRTGRRHLRAAEHFIDWAKRQGLSVPMLDLQALARFRRHLDRCRCRYAHANRIEVFGRARMFLRYLCDAEIVGASALDDAGDEPALLMEFAMWMRQQRGACAATLDKYHRPIRDLLRQVGNVPSRWDVHQIRMFVLEQSQGAGWGAAKRCTTAVRMFIRFLIATGHCPVGFDAVIPAIACWRLATLPRYLQPAEVERVIGSCDRTTAVGCRDRAILLLLARLGLRGGDIVQLRLRDIDWRGASIEVSGKSRRPTRLPLTQEVGQALARYLLHGRPSTNADAVFVRCRPPFRAFRGSSTISVIVDQALRRARVSRPSRGAAHLLRHSVASSMLREGASLQDIAAVLRHRSIHTTEIYAKVDVRMLQAIAQPWPEVRPC
jgi:site-specific recombinase XerD